MPRVVSRYGDDGAYRVDSAKVLGTILHLHPDTPYIYQGEELGMTTAPFASAEDFQDIESLDRHRRVMHAADAQADYRQLLAEDPALFVFTRRFKAPSCWCWATSAPSRWRWPYRPLTRVCGRRQRYCWTPVHPPQPRSTAAGIAAGWHRWCWARGRLASTDVAVVGRYG